MNKTTENWTGMDGEKMLRKARLYQTNREKPRMS